MPVETVATNVPATSSLWSTVTQAIQLIFWVAIGLVVLFILYKVAEWWFNRNKFELIDILGMNAKQLFNSAKKNVIPACKGHELVSLGSTHKWGLIDGTVYLESCIDLNPKKKEYFDSKKMEYDIRKMETDKYEPTLAVFRSVIFLLEENRNRVIRFLMRFIAFLRKPFLVEIPFDLIWVYKHLGDGSFTLKRLERYGEMKGNVYADCNSLLLEHDGIYRPSYWSPEGVEAFENQIFKHRYLILLKDTVNQVRAAGLTNHEYVKVLDMNSVKRDVQQNQNASTVQTIPKGSE
jgi:hypothetical protein